MWFARDMLVTYVWKIPITDKDISKLRVPAIPIREDIIEIVKEKDV